MSNRPRSDLSLYDVPTWGSEAGGVIAYLRPTQWPMSQNGSPESLTESFYCWTHQVGKQSRWQALGVTEGVSSSCKEFTCYLDPDPQIVSRNFVT
jgi:hypothetical protein